MDKIIKFLQDKIIGVEMYTDELTYTLEDGKLEGVYSDQIIFSNLLNSNFGISFDMFLTARETIYELRNNNRNSIRSNQNGVSVFRYELAKRNSTGEVTGIFRLVNTSNQNQTAQAIVCSVFNMKLDNDTLKWSEEQVLYRDQASADGKFHAVAFDSKNRFFFEDGKARFEYNGTCFDVDTNTFAKTISKDIFPQFLAKEK